MKSQKHAAERDMMSLRPHEHSGMGKEEVTNEQLYRAI